MFNAEEKAQVVNLISGVITPLNSALLNELSVSVKENQDLPANLKPVLVAVKEALRESSLALSLLMNGNGDATFSIPDPTKRSARLTLAWFHLDRVTMFTQSAILALGKCGGANAVRAKTIWLPQVIAGVKKIDRSLPYVNPNPNDHGTLIGPHGDWVRSTWELWRAWWYATDLLEYALDSYPQDMAVNWYAVINKLPILYGTLARGIARFTDIDTTDKERQIRATLTNPAGQQFFLLLGYSQVLTDFATNPPGMPEFYEELQEALAAGSPALASARIRLTDSWRHMDKAVWHALLEFPGCDMLNDPAGCAAKLPSQQPVVVTKEVLPSHFSATLDGETLHYEVVPPEG